MVNMLVNFISSLLSPQQAQKAQNIHVGDELLTTELNKCFSQVAVITTIVYEYLEPKSVCLNSRPTCSKLYEPTEFSEQPHVCISNQSDLHKLSRLANVQKLKIIDIGFGRFDILQFCALTQLILVKPVCF